MNVLNIRMCFLVCSLVVILPPLQGVGQQNADASRTRLQHTTAAPFLSRSGAGERLEEATPVACAVEDGAHLIAPCPVTVKVSMFQFDTRTVLAICDEAHLDLCL